MMSSISNKLALQRAFLINVVSTDLGQLRSFIALHNDGTYESISGHPLIFVFNAVSGI